MSAPPLPGGGAPHRQFAFDVGYRMSLLLDPDGTVRAVTEMANLGDTPATAFLGRSVIDISAKQGSGAQGSATWQVRLDHVREATSTVHYADAVPGADDLRRSIDSSLTPIRRADGSLEAILLIVEDRSDFFLNQARLYESEKQFRTLAESLPQKVWISDATGKVVYFAPRWQAFTGRSEAELLELGLTGLIHPDDQAHLSATANEIRHDRPIVFRLLRHDGEWRTMEAFAQPMHDEAGQLIRHVGATIDITERRRAEERTRETQEQLRSALAMTGLGRFTIELRPPALSADERVSEIIGSIASELLADADPEHLFDPIHLADKERVRQAFNRTLAGHGDFDEEYRIHRPTEGEPEERWVAVAGRVEFDGDGPVRMFGVIEDTTDRRRGDDARLRMQKREAIGTLAGGIAHDFNNVIGAILSNAALAEMELGAGESPRTSIAEIRRGAQRAADLVRRMLAFSREDEPSRAAVDLSDVTHEACALLRPTLPHEVTLEITAEPGAVVLGDATQLHQVVMNLVTNAGQALGEDGGRIEVRIDRPGGSSRGTNGASTAGHGAASPRLRLRVRDDGPGMPEEVARRAFDPFFTTKAHGEGTGLGLAATQTIVHSHGGVIAIDSVVGRHTTVEVVLPAAQADRADPEVHATDHDTGQRRDEGPPRVLFVDDEQALAHLADRAMPSYGCSVTVFTDPADAVAAFTASPHTFDALVTDLSMPGLTGLELCAALRAVRPELPVILTSGFLTPEHEEEAGLQCVDEIIAKPCSIGDLAAAVLRLTS